jgi:uncharacterized protein with ParB-like and HNH nuclease domain
MTPQWRKHLKALRAAQLPDFQRGWVWENWRICSLIASISNSYPVAALMFMEYGGDSVRFKYRLFECGATTKMPDFLVLDGQQRLTSVFCSMFCRDNMKTKNKTQLSYRSNRIIQGDAPSMYLTRIVKQNNVSEDELNKALVSHLVNVSDIRGDDFQAYFIKRAKALLSLIGTAMGKPIQNLNSDEVIKDFGGSLE